ncbi:MAG: alpha-ketoacid dehydrogenase subunit beta [Firmicutes bacterium]|nr:alpha-ketoacid dehydrogenase subunit beta [Alicyclobacillaceae bacterium]MCL6496525.1 alpha-ketoacid dehydrogenase subunit beta [Bacillota bacterium]
MAEWTYAEAIRQALTDAMAEDDAVLLLGEDVALGGPFGVTRGLRERFGAGRVLNTPISEAAITGFAVGAALAGRRPVVEIMFMDFITLALDMLANQAAKLALLSGFQQAVPLVVRTQAGIYHSAGAQHSQSLEAWLVHVPGLAVVAPGVANDAYRAVRWALRQPGPVVVMEHKGLYGRRQAREALEWDPQWRPGPQLRRPGRDATVVTYSAMGETALAAASALERDGISVEVWDLLGLSPLNLEPVLESVRRTHRVLIVHEAVVTGGLGAELAARLQSEVFDDLDAPIFRLGGRPVAIPFSPPLERAVIPSAEAVAEAVRTVLA